MEAILLEPSGPPPDAWQRQPSKADDRKARARKVFVGVYDRSIDDNGRLSLPSSFRGDLGDRCYATLDPQGCVTLRTAEVFEAEAAEVIEAVKRDEAAAGVRRSLATNTTAVAVDKQGRLTLDDKARAFAGLTEAGTAMIVGNLNTIELWRPSRYETVAAEDDYEVAPRVWRDE
ncbi:MAG: hypothetical protein EBR65_00270 [Actinobacteria bacterium]|nr:hypothetical protein [Actinomycetota bacterium]